MPLLSLSLLFLLLHVITAQPPPPATLPPPPAILPPPPATLPPPPAAQPPTSDLCNGIYLSYTHTKTLQLPPNLNSTTPALQPFRFESTLRLLNNGLTPLLNWRAFLALRRGSRLVSVANAVLAAGDSLPATVVNGTALVGFPATDLETAIDTAGDLSLMGARVDLVGVQFGVAPPDVPMPSSLSLLNDGFLCPPPTFRGRNVMEVCCTEDPDFRSNATLDEEFLPRQTGDLTMNYDILRTYDSSYWAQVTIANHNPLGRLDYWNLRWEWMKGEFIHTMIGAYPSVVDSSDCIFGPQGQHYRDLDFSTVLNCERKPTIVDLPLSKYNDTKLGFRPYCCRNGTILPPSMDVSRSVSSFQLEVFKMPDELNRSRLTPPQNWNIVGTEMNPKYECGSPIRVSPSESPDASGVPVNSTSVASWQIACNITHPVKASPKCCVSFSAYYNDSVVPCKTQACGANVANEVSCSATAPAMLLPPDALLVPFANRTAKALAWAALKRTPVPNPLPCPDNCGVSLNWHVVSDYTRGWSARVTIFNWGGENYADWFAAARMDRAAPGFERMYSFNGSSLVVDGVNTTLFMEGLPGLNYLVAESDAANPSKDPRVPGKQQTVISFTKKQTPGINVPRGDGFPTRVLFNGEECSLPTHFPTNDSVSKKRFSSALSLLISLVLAISMLIL